MHIQYENKLTMISKDMLLKRGRIYQLIKNNKIKKKNDRKTTKHYTGNKFK